MRHGNKGIVLPVEDMPYDVCRRYSSLPSMNVGQLLECHLGLGRCFWDDTGIHATPLSLWCREFVAEATFQHPI